MLIVKPKPELEISSDASRHYWFSLAARRQIDLHSVLDDFGVNPHEDFTFLIEEYHIFINHKITVAWGEFSTRYDDSTGVGKSFFIRIEIL